MYYVLSLIDWAKLGEGLKAHPVETGIELVLPTVGLMIAAFVVYKAIKHWLRAG
jgi:hypothetical protein